MKTSARFLAMLLAVVMIASAALSVSAFDDVTGNKHANAIDVLAQLKVIGGYEDGTFKPDQKVTRAEMAKLVYVLYTTFVDAGTGVTAFSDVAADNWAAGYIRWCAQKGVIGGYGNGTFGPTDNVTYDQALKMVAGVLGYNEWDSALWPTDVRMLALKTLNLGEELEDVNGNDQLTRAQVAQLLYNALDENMNEKKAENYETAEGFLIPYEVPKKLAVDTWKFQETTLEVDGINDKDVTIDVYGTYTDKDGNEAIYDETWELAEYGLAKYEDDIKLLNGLDITALIKLDAKGEAIILSSALKGTFTTGVEVKYNEKTPEVLAIAGVAHKYDAKKATGVMVSIDGATAESAFEKTEKNGKTIYTVKKNVYDALEMAYMARAIDEDGNGYVDELAIATKTAYKVGKVDSNKADGKFAPFTTVDGKTTVETKVLLENVNIEVAEDDIIVAAKFDDKFYAEKVEAVEDYATAVNKTKITLAGAGEVKFDKLTIAGAIGGTYGANELGADNKSEYYIYNGEIIYSTVVSKQTNFDFAILKCITVDTNTSSSKVTNDYYAYLIVDGEEVKLPLNAKEAIKEFVGGEKDEFKFIKASEAINTYPADYGTAKNDGDAEDKTEYINYNYTLVESYVEEDGLYTLNIGAAKEENNVKIVAAGASLEYNADLEYYTIGGEEDLIVVLDDASVIFYKNFDEDEEMVVVESYNKDTITKKAFEEAAVTVSDIYLVTKDEGATYILLGTMVDAPINGSTEGKAAYLTDGTLILYAPYDSNITLEADGKKYYNYTFKGDVTDKAEVSSKVEATESGKFYGWNGDKYVEVEAKNDANNFKAVTLDTIVKGINILKYNNGEQIKLPADVTIWGLDKTEEETNDTYVELTIDELAEMLKLVEEETDDAVRAIFVQAKDAKDEDTWNLKTIIVEIFEENETTEKVEPINSTIFGKE